MNIEQERQAFEAGINPHCRKRNEHGDYVVPEIQDRWDGWQARAAQPQQAVAVTDEAHPDTGRLDFILQKLRSVTVERLPHDNFEVYVEEGAFGDIKYPGVRYSGEWRSSSQEAQEIKRKAIDAALSAHKTGGEE